MKKTTVIIPNYNGIDFLKGCLAALDRQNGSGFDTIVVDNGSEDGSVEWLRQTRPKTRVLAFKRNTGFCHAVNTGVKAAHTPYVLLLNNDTIPREDFVAELENGLENHPGVFSCASCMLTAADETILDGAGDLYSALGWGFARGKDEKADRYQKEVYVFGTCAGAAIYRREEFIRLGLLDETHFAYLEDMDLSWRARLAGWRNRYIPTAQVVHYGSGTTGGRHSEFKVRMSARNNFYMIRKNMAPWQKFINALPVAAGLLIKYLYFRRKGFGTAYLTGLKEGMALPAKQAGYTSRRTQLVVQLELWLNMFRRRH